MLIMHIGHISRTQSFQQNRHIIFHALVALKLLVYIAQKPPRSLFCENISDPQTNYCNPRCACVPRVNNTYTVMYLYRVNLIIGLLQRMYTYTDTVKELGVFIHNTHTLASFPGLSPTLLSLAI